MSYATLEHLRAYLSLSATDTNDDALLEAFLLAAQAVIEDACGGRHFYYTRATRLYDATGPHITTNSLLLREDLAQIYTLTNGDGTTIPSTAYVLIPANRSQKYSIELLPSAGITFTHNGDWRQAISIDGLWGYSEEPPPPIIQACIRLAAWLYRQRETNEWFPYGAEKVTALALSAVDSLPADAHRLIAPFKKITIFGA